ncbi:CBN-TPST-2 protein [Caenorhabditis brenneri]|uniref:Protein-tyrosine sulfotransferase n=1 Tax=Caenorhabditis brenneri TaxID=135651 RepID=G0MYX9_CAEBE|nr:CBN-TPST-2 protein [Caenorhabditis brenneri]
MRAILDAHPDVRCGGETMLLPSFLTWQAGWRTDWVNNSGITREVFDSAISAFMTEAMFAKWNQEIRKMLFQCNNLPGQCMKVYYERLIQKPEDEVERITSFLGLTFSPQMLKHHELIGAEVDLNEQEFSASQVKHSINTDALKSWFDCFSDETLQRLEDVAPLLGILGYNTSSSNPDYSQFADDNFYQYRQLYS